MPFAIVIMLSVAIKFIVLSVIIQNDIMLSFIMLTVIGTVLFPFSPFEELNWCLWYVSILNLVTSGLQDLNVHNPEHNDS